MGRSDGEVIGSSSFPVEQDKGFNQPTPRCYGLTGRMNRINIMQGREADSEMSFILSILLILSKFPCPKSAIPLKTTKNQTIQE